MSNHKYLVNINDNLWSYLKGRADFLGIPVSQLVRSILLSDWENAMYGKGGILQFETIDTPTVKSEDLEKACNEINESGFFDKYKNRVVSAADLDSDDEVKEFEMLEEDMRENDMKRHSKRKKRIFSS